MAEPQEVEVEAAAEHTAEVEEEHTAEVGEKVADATSNEDKPEEDDKGVAQENEGGGRSEEMEANAASKEGEERSKSEAKVWSTDPREGVWWPMGESGVASEERITVGKMLQETVRKFSSVPAVMFEEDGEWKSVTYSEYYDLCVSAAKSFLKLGLEPFHSVAILGFNSLEWFICNIAAVFAGGLSTGIYTTNSPEACHFIADNCKANVIVVENQKQLDKILQIRDRLPHLKAIVQYKGKLSQEYENVYDWEQFMELGKDMESSEIEKIISEQKPEQCALLVYTSGTTGNPKGVMLSHDNLTWITKATTKHISFEDGNERVVSYLPLCHVAAQIADIFIPFSVAATIYLARPDALKGSLVGTLHAAQPTLFFGVPRVWEKFKEAMQAAGANFSSLKKWIAQWAKGKNLQGYRNKLQNQPVPWGWSIANRITNPVREKLGLSQCRICLTGSAPTSIEVMEFFMSLNIPVYELFGMSENTGPHTVNTAERWCLGSCGSELPGVETKIDDPDEDGNGELCMRGRHIFMGYLNNEEKTREAIDDEGWLHSGDIGKMKNGFLFITGRIKELIITAGGKNIAPVPLEDAIKKELPFLSNVMVIGDKRKFLSCLVSLKCVMNPETGEPMDELLPQAKQMIAALGCQCSTVSEIVEQKNKAVFDEIEAGLKRANAAAPSQAQCVQKFTLLGQDFSIPGGELGPTLKLKRFTVDKKFAKEIDAMYDV